MTAAIKINQNDGKTRNVMTGGETEVDFDFPIFAATHLAVYETDTAGDITLLVKDTDYTVPVGSVGVQAGGTIDLDATQYPSGATAGHVFTVYQNAPQARTTDFNQAGDFFADTLNQELDLITQQIQQLGRDLDRAPLAPVDTTLTGLTLPDPVDESTLVWDGTSGLIKNGPTSDEISSAQTYANNASASATQAADSATAAATSETNAGTSETNAGASATAAAASETAAEAAQTAAEAAQAAAETAETNAETAETNAETAQTAAEAAQVAAETAETNAETAETNAGNSATAAAGSAAAAATSETNAGTSETNAAASAAAAAASAAEGLYNDVVTLTNADSPYVPTAIEEGTLFRLDMTSGAITINLSTLATYAEDMKFAFVKVDSGSNSATINRGGTDTISGGTSILLATQYETHVIVGDSAAGSWIDTVQTTGIADNSVTNAKLANMATQTIKGRNTAGTGDPEDLTAAQVRGIADVYSQAEVDAAVAAAGAPVKVIQRVRSELSTAATSSTVIPLDNTVPQNTEGGEIITRAITPTNAGNTLKIRAEINCTCSNANTVVIALFQDSAAGALASAASLVGLANLQGPKLIIDFEMPAGTTSATTFKIRIGPVSSATVTVNGSGGSQLFGGTFTSTLEVVEIEE